MSALLRHLLSADYLYALNDVPLGAWPRGYVRWALLLGLGILLVGVRAARRRARGVPGEPLARAELAWAGWCALDLALLLWRVYGTGPLTARVWYLSAGAGVLLWPPLAQLPLAWPRRAPRHWRGAWAWPLLLPATTLLLRGLAGGALGVDLAPYRAFPYPDPWAPLFDLRISGAAALAGLLIIIGSRRHLPERRPWLARGLAWALPVLAAGWYLAIVAVHLSHGATGSDPFCYLQMAADLAEHGTARGVFGAVTAAHAAGVPLWPAVPVGYHPPAAGGLAATVWPIGWPLLLAPLYRLGGEALALWGAPLAALAAAALAGRLAAAGPAAPGRKYQSLAVLAAGGLAAALLLTSPEVVDRTLVPMGDAAAAALAALTLLALRRAGATDRLRWSALAGLAWGAAYFVRHPLLGLGVAAFPALLGAPWPRRRRLAHLAAFGGVALLVALPDLAYHARAFGSPWIAESPEWHLLGLRYLPGNLAAVADELWRRGEWGYLAPLALLGAGAMWRRGGDARREGIVWALALAGIAAMPLCYGALRPRDLIPLFPLLAAWTARGAAEVGRMAGRGRTAVLAAALLLLAARFAPSADLPGRAAVASFGHVSAAQRAGFEALAALLPADAVVGAGLNAGAVARYTGRDAVRPAAWSPAEWAAYRTALGGRAVYLLDDGEEMAAWLARQDPAALEQVATLDLPTMAAGGAPLARPATLYRLAP